MGAEADATWFIDGSAQELGYCCFNAATRDYARFADTTMSAALTTEELRANSAGARARAARAVRRR